MGFLNANFIINWVLFMTPILKLHEGHFIVFENFLNFEYGSNRIY